MLVGLLVGNQGKSCLDQSSCWSIVILKLGPIRQIRISLPNGGIAFVFQIVIKLYSPKNDDVSNPIMKHVHSLPTVCLNTCNVRNILFRASRHVLQHLPFKPVYIARKARNIYR